MDSNDLTPGQLNTIRRRTQPMALYLFGLRVRMQVNQFPQNDPLRVLVTDAEALLDKLNAELTRRAENRGHALQQRRAKRKSRDSR